MSLLIWSSEWFSTTKTRSLVTVGVPGPAGVAMDAVPLGVSVAVGAFGAASGGDEAQPTSRAVPSTTGAARRRKVTCAACPLLPAKNLTAEDQPTGTLITNVALGSPSTTSSRLNRRLI